MIVKHPIDVHVGSRVRLRRIQLNLSKEELADYLKVTVGQTHLYESGAETIGASTLFEIAKTLEVLPTYFFDDLEEVLARRPSPDS